MTEPKSSPPIYIEDGRFIVYDGGYYGFTAYTEFLSSIANSSTQKIPDPSGCVLHICVIIRWCQQYPPWAANVLYLLNVNNSFIDYLYLYDQQTSSNEPVLSNIDGSPMGGFF